MQQFTFITDAQSLEYARKNGKVFDSWIEAKKAAIKHYNSEIEPLHPYPENNVTAVSPFPPCMVVVKL
jgi:hypothetical protein